MRHTLVLLLALIGAIIFSGTAWGAAITCSDALAPTNVPILQLSASTDAHGELNGSYPVTVRCRTAPSGLLSSTSNLATLFYLAASTDGAGHAATLTNPDEYAFPVTLGLANSGTGTIVTAIAQPGQTCDTLDIDIGGPNEINYSPVVRLSRETNAHLQSPNYGGSPYDYTICVAIAPPGAPLPENTISEDAPVPNGFVSGSAGTVEVVLNNLVAGNPLYANVTTLQITGLCNVTVNPAECSALDNYSALRTEFATYFANPAASILVNGSVQGTNYGSTDNPLGFPSGAPNLDGGTSFSNAYPINPTALGMGDGTYRFFVINLAALSTFNGTPNTPEPGTEYGDNWSQVDLTLSGSGAAGSGGDVYVLKSIQYPNLYRNLPISVKIGLTNKQFAPGSPTNNAMLHFVVRRSNGEYVPGYSFNPATQTYDVSLPIVFTSDTLIHTQEIQPANGVTFNVGETDTLYATISPYADAADPTNSESVTGNNSAFRTFTTLDPPQSFSIPDNSAWLSMCMVAIVLGWLFVSSRKK